MKLYVSRKPLLLSALVVVGPVACSDSDGAVDPAPIVDDTGTTPTEGVETCDDLAALFENAPSSVETSDCALTDGSTATCCTMTFGSDLQEDGPYCPPSLTSPPPYGLSVYDGATNPGLRAFNGEYMLDIEADGYDPMVDADGNTNIVTALGGGPPASGSGSNCLAIDQDPTLTLTVYIPLEPRQASAATTIGSVQNLGVSVYGVPATGDPPSAVNGPMMGPGGGEPRTNINVPSIGSCGAHPDPGGYLHDHFIPQVMNRVLEANGISAEDVECTSYEQRTTGLYGFAKDGYPIYSSRDEESALPTDLDECNGHTGVTKEFPGGTYHYHADEELAPNYPDCLKGVPVEVSFTYQ